MKILCSNQDLGEVGMLRICLVLTLLWRAALSWSLDLDPGLKREFLLRIASQLMFDIEKLHLLLVTGQFGAEYQNLRRRRCLAEITRLTK